jgi:hypothetical protein
MADHPTIMGLLTTGNTRRLANVTLVVLFALIRPVDAAATYQSISRSGRKEMTFFLTSFRGCGGVVIYSRGCDLDPR